MKKLISLTILLAFILCTMSTALAADIKVESLQELRELFYFTLDGVEYHAPAPVSQYLENGWTLTDTHDVSSLDAMTYLSYNTMEKGDVAIQVELLNATEEEQPLESCVVTQMDIWADLPVDFTTLKGVGVGSSLQDVLDAYDLSIEFVQNNPDNHYALLCKGEEISSIDMNQVGWLDYFQLNYVVTGAELDLLSNVSRELYTSYSGDNYIYFQFDQPILAEGTDPKVSTISYRIMLPEE